ncbi:MAG TPA: CDGSH iron-sulfur domain-containing protein [Steroidobacteraceae bacterium]|nr:CDGSH iron-sulfur domain-containing protein [Steroidobacteraceae bacterium]
MADRGPGNVLTINENGPLTVEGELTVEGRAMSEAHLCRCGRSKRKPFCDGSHAANFVASGEPSIQSPGSQEPPHGSLVVTPVENGPLRITGPLTIRSAGGRTIDSTTQSWLCRCGASAKKPYCDGTHKRIRFEAPGETPRRK